MLLMPSWVILRLPHHRRERHATRAGPRLVPGEVHLHRREVTLLPAAFFVAPLIRGNVAVTNRDEGPVVVALEPDFDLGVFMLISELSRSPRLHDAARRLEFEGLSVDVNVPRVKIVAAVWTNVGFAASHRGVPLCRQPRRVNFIGRRRNLIRYFKVVGHARSDRKSVVYGKSVDLGG